MKNTREMYEQNPSTLDICELIDYVEERLNTCALGGVGKVRYKGILGCLKSHNRFKDTIQDLENRLNVKELDNAGLRSRVAVMKGTLSLISSPTYWSDLKVDSDASQGMQQQFIEIQKLASMALETEGQADE